MSFYTSHFDPESIEIGRVHNNKRDNKRDDELKNKTYPYTFHIFIDSDERLNILNFASW